MHARMTTIEADPERIDEMVSRLEEEDLPTWRRIPGFRGFTLLIDRVGGRVVGTSYWSSEEAMEASEEQVRGSRERAAQTVGSDSPPRVEAFEVGLDTFVS